LKYLVASEKPALIHSEGALNFQQLLCAVREFSQLYSAVETQRVAIFSENRPEWTFAFYSAWYLKKTAVPIDYLSAPSEVDYILRDCRPEVIFCSRERYEIIKAVLEALPYGIHVLIFEDLQPCRDLTEVVEFPDLDPELTAMIIYTSGTTGSPKGVMLSFKNVNANIYGVTVTNVFTEATVVLGLLPMHHTFPLMGTMVGPLAVQGTLVLCPSMASEDIMRTLQENQITTIVAVPRFYNLIRKGIRDKIKASFLASKLFALAEKLQSPWFSKRIFKKVHAKLGGHIRFLVCGGAAIDEEVARDYKTLGFEMLEGYGMTETGPMISFTRPGRRRIGSPGEVLQGCEVEIRDGEIVARGDNVMQGYFNRPDETAQVIRDGWLHTGDLGSIDEDGFLYIQGRKKEIIVLSNGKNVNPVEIEFDLMARSDYLAEVGVYDVKDQLHAVLFPDFKRMEADSIHQIEQHYEEVMEQYNATVSSYKKIIKFSITKDELPKTRLGKLRRFLLKEVVDSRKVDEALISPEEEPDDQTYLLIKSFLVQQTEGDVRPSDHIEIDLGLDSLDKVNFLSYLEHTFGVELEDTLFSKYGTLKSLAAYISEHKKRIIEESVNWGSILKQKLDLKLPKAWVSQIWIKYFCRISFKLYFRFKTEGRNNIPDGPCILAPNHQSFFDGFLIQSILKNIHLKKTYFYAKEKHWRQSWLKFLASRHNVIIMDVNKDLRQSLQKMAAALQSGKNIIIFPEGTRTKDGTLGKFKKTFAILSSELNVPVVPVSIQGAYDVLPRGKWFPKPWKQVVVKFAPPIYPENHTVESLQEAVYKDVLNAIAPEKPAA